MRQHPRVAYQGLLTEPETTTRIVAALPALLSFRKAYAGAIAIIDWDHKLPSDCLFLRIFGFYTEASLEAGHAAFDDRIDEITARWSPSKVSIDTSPSPSWPNRRWCSSAAST